MQSQIPLGKRIEEDEKKLVKMKKRLAKAAFDLEEAEIQHGLLEEEVASLEADLEIMKDELEDDQNG